MFMTRARKTKHGHTHCPTCHKFVAFTSTGKLRSHGWTMDDDCIKQGFDVTVICHGSGRQMRETETTMQYTITTKETHTLTNGDVETMRANFNGFRIKNPEANQLALAQVAVKTRLGEKHPAGWNADHNDIIKIAASIIDSK